MRNLERMAGRLAALSLAALAIAAVSASTALAASVDYYIGPTTDGYWSTLNNWNPNISPDPVGCDVIFNDAYGTGTTNYAEDNVTSPGNLISIGAINSLWYAQDDTSYIHTTQIDAGCTLKITGVNPTAAPGFAATDLYSLFAGNVGATQYSVLKTVITGDGKLDVSDPNSQNTTGNIIVAMGNANPGTTYPDHTAILDMSNLATFNANADQLLIGVEASGSGLDRPNGIMYLAKNNTIKLNNTTSFVATTGGTSCNLPGGALIVGYTSNKGAGDTYVCALYLGQTNTINADYVLVGGRLRPGAMGFESKTNSSSLTLRGTSNSRVVSINIGDETNNSTGGNPTTGAVDLTGGSVDIMATAIVVGSSTTNYVAATTRNGYKGTGTLSFDTGTIDTTGMTIANQATDINSSASGTVNVSGSATLTIGSSGLAMSNYIGTTTNGQQANSTSTLNISGNSTVTVGANISMNTTSSGNGPSNSRSLTSAINITGGSVTVNGNIVKGAFTSMGGTDTATIKLDGGTLNMAGNSIGTATTIDTLNLYSGTLKNVGGVNAAGVTTLIKNWDGTTPKTLILDGSNTYTGDTKVTGGTLQFAPGVSVVNSSVFDVYGGTLDVTAFSPGGYNLGSGKRLQGNGTVLGSINIAGTLAPGESPGKLTITGSVGISGTMLEEINGATTPGTDYDQLLVTDNGSTPSNITLSGTLALTVSGTYTPSGGDKIWVINDTGTGTLTGSFTPTGLPSGWQVLCGVNYDPISPNLTPGSGNDVVVLPIPEPAALLMLIMAAGLGLLYKRRRNK